MARPRCILLAAPNGAGNSSLYETFVAARFPELECINADRIANERRPGAESAHAYEAARTADAMRRLAQLSGFALEMEGFAKKCL